MAGLVGLLLTGERGVSQTLTVSPHKIATGTLTKEAGTFLLDSLKGSQVRGYVPQSCVGTRRCPLVVYLSPVETFDLQLQEADKYGMIALAVPEGEHLDLALKQTLRRFAIDPDKIAVMGFSHTGSLALHLGITSDVFSRVVALSPSPLDPGDTIVSPRNRKTQFYIAGGLSESHQTVMMLGPFWSGFLQPKGYPVEQVLVFRSHEIREEDGGPVWRWLHESWMTPTTASQTVPLAFPADSIPLLTPEAVAQLTTFWIRFMQQPDSVRTTARKAHQKEITVPIGRVRVSVVMMDLPVLAAKYSSIAEALWIAGLTARQAEAYRIALIAARPVVTATKFLSWSAVEGQSNSTHIAVRALSAIGPLPVMSQIPMAPEQWVLGRNADFVIGHESEIWALAATNMWTTP